MKELDARRKEVVEQLKATAYFERQAHSLLSRFPDAKLAAVLGLVPLVGRNAIEPAERRLPPGRSAGVAPPEADGDFAVEAALRDSPVG